MKMEIYFLKLKVKKWPFFIQVEKNYSLWISQIIAVYHENGKEVFSNSDEGVKINGEAAEKSLLDMFSKDKLLKTALLFINF